jgi:hypothetical protein
VRVIRILTRYRYERPTEACTRIGFGLAERFDSDLEVLHPCPALAQRLPYATELNPIYFKESMDVGAKQAELEKRQSKVESHGATLPEGGNYGRSSRAHGSEARQGF